MAKIDGSRAGGLGPHYLEVVADVDQDAREETLGLIRRLLVDALGEEKCELLFALVTKSLPLRELSERIGMDFSTLSRWSKELCVKKCPPSRLHWWLRRRRQLRDNEALRELLRIRRQLRDNEALRSAYALLG